MAAKSRLRSFQLKGKFARSVSVLIGGAAIGQIIVMMASPILTRIYSPESFGLLAIYAGLLGIIGVITSLCYEFAIPLATRDEDAASIVALCLSIALTITLLMVVIVGAWADTISIFLNAPTLAPYLWLLPIGVFFLGIYQTLNYWAIREKSFSAVAKTKLMQSLGMTAMQIGGYSLGAFSLIFGQIIGHAAGILPLVLTTIRPKKNIFYSIRILDLYRVAKRWYKFPLYSSWSGMFNTASAQVPVLLFAALFSPTVAGIYMLAQRVLDMPMRIVGQAISNVFFVSSTEALRKGRLADLVSDIHERLAHFAMPPTLILILLGPDLFSVIFGPEWRQAGIFAQWMAPWLYAAFITSPLSQLFFVLEKQGLCMILQGALLITRVFCLVIGARMGDVTFTVGIFSVGSVICYIGFLVWIIYASGNSFHKFLLSSLRSFLISGSLVSPIILSNQFWMGEYNWMIALTIAMILVMVRYVLLLKNT